MKLIILILANDTTIYLQCQALWKKYMHLHPNIKSYFIKFNENLDTHALIKDDTIFIKGTESYYPGCLLKTIESIKYLLSVEDFDFIFRTNMSSVVDLNKLYNLLHNNNNHYSGVIVQYYNIIYASGAGILLSKCICEFLINNNHLINYDLIDDVSIGLFLQINNIAPHPLTRFEAYNYTQNVDLITKEIINDYYHFRCKDENHTNTILLMEKIINMIY